MNPSGLVSTTLLPSLLLAAAVLPARSQEPGDCGRLAELRLEDTNLLSATVVPAGDELPEYCRVLGYVRPAIQFEVRLPTRAWNGKFYMAGCGGFCGRLASDNSGFVNAIDHGLERGYAVSTTDGGHWGRDVFDARWAHHDRIAEIDWGHRAVHETARVTKYLIDAFYGGGPQRSYFAGCSTGGRQAVMEAVRYPGDFDGVISGAPDVDASEWAIFTAWLGRANAGPGGENLLTPEDARLVGDAVYEACDGADGLEDGLVSDPGACSFEPASLACGEDDDGAGCLSPEQVRAAEAFYEGPRTSDGRRLYPGVPLGSEPFWGAWLTGATADAGDDLIPQAGLQYLRYMGFAEDPGERYQLDDFDFDEDPERLRELAPIYDAGSPDLDTFRARGGKLLIWHGWADAAVPPGVSVEYYESVEERVGDREETRDFLRLFLVPGMDHCGIGDGPGIDETGFDPLTALERWVERGEAPERLLTTKTGDDGEVSWTRPVCPYPERAIYRGEGDRDEASSFECLVP